MPKQRTLACLAFITYTYMLPSYGKELVFDSPANTSCAFTYQANVKSITPGDTIVLNEYQSSWPRWLRSPKFMRTYRFRTSGLIARGSNTNIYGLIDFPDRVLRLCPCQREFYEVEEWPLTAFISLTIHGYQELKDSGVPIARMFEHAHGLFAVVERVEGPSLNEFLVHPDCFNKEQITKMHEALRNFARASANMKYIGDFHSEQMVYVEARDKWMVRDWSIDNCRAQKLTDSNIFSALSALDFSLGDSRKNDFWIERVFDDLRIVVHEERKARGCEPLLNKFSAY